MLGPVINYTENSEGVNAAVPDFAGGCVRKEVKTMPNMFILRFHGARLVSSSSHTHAPLLLSHSACMEHCGGPATVLLGCFRVHAKASAGWMG